jgi:hypothetical protein
VIYVWIDSRKNEWNISLRQNIMFKGKILEFRMYYGGKIQSTLEH